MQLLVAPQIRFIRKRSLGRLSLRSASMRLCLGKIFFKRERRLLIAARFCLVGISACASAFTSTPATDLTLLKTVAYRYAGA